MAREKIAQLSKGVGRPKVGGPVTGLVDQNGKVRDDAEFVGKHRLVSRRWRRKPGTQRID